MNGSRLFWRGLRVLASPIVFVGVWSALMLDTAYVALGLMARLDAGFSNLVLPILMSSVLPCGVYAWRAAVWVLGVRRGSCRTPAGG